VLLRPKQDTERTNQPIAGIIIIITSITWSRPRPQISPSNPPQVCTAFAAGYQAVAVAGWLQYFLLLRFLEWNRRRLRHWITAWLVHALGFLLAMAVGGWVDGWIDEWMRVLLPPPPLPAWIMDRIDRWGSLRFGRPFTDRPLPTCTLFSHVGFVQRS
jgi:hypothetical protein